MRHSEKTGRGQAKNSCPDERKKKQLDLTFPLGRDWKGPEEVHLKE